MRRFGANAALGERAMSLKIANHKVVDCLVRMNCNPRADGDWLYWRACELQDTALCTIILDGIQPSKQTLGHFVNVAAMKGAASIIDLIVEHYGADIHQPDGEDRVLMLACAENRVDIVRHLVDQYGCNVHSNKERHYGELVSMDTLNWWLFYYQEQMFMLTMTQHFKMQLMLVTLRL